MKDFYESYWQHRIDSHYIHTRDGMWVPERVYAALRLLGTPSQPIKVLDVGCGEGTVGKMLKEKLGNKVHVTGLDISATALQMASTFYDRVAEFDADADSLQEILQQEKFDCIIALEMLEHLFNPKRALEQFKMALANEGCLLASVPNMVHWQYRLQYLRGAMPKLLFTFLGKKLPNLFGYQIVLKLKKK